jgi:hypothetical protein
MEHEKHEMVLSMLVIPVNPLAPGKGWKLTGDPLPIGLVADNTVLAKEALADHFWIGSVVDRGGTAASPIDGMGFVNILTEAAAVKGEVKAAPEDRGDEGPDEPWGKGRNVGGFTSPALLVFFVVIVIHG